MPLARNGSLVSTFSSPTGPCLRAISAMRASSSTRSRAASRLMVKANRAPSGRPCTIALSGKRIMVAAIDPPKMMMTACSLQNISRLPPSNMITVMTAMPHNSPTSVMISMANPNANATFRPSWTETRLIPSRVGQPYGPAIKDGLPNLVVIIISKQKSGNRDSMADQAASAGSAGSHSFLAGERAGDAFQRFSFGVDAEPPFDDGGHQQQQSRQRIAGADRPARSRFDQRTEQQRRQAAPDQGTQRIKHRDRQRPGFKREDFACRQIGRTRRSGSKEENDQPGN